MQRRHFIKTTVLLGAALASGAPIRSNSQALDRADLNELGPQGERLAGRIGLWDLSETIWKSPGAEPQTSAGLIAERFMMPAWSKNACNGKSIDLDFYLIAAWNDGGRGGILMRMRQVTTFDRPDSDTKDQYLTLADGTGGWLGHRYSFKRHSYPNRAPHRSDLPSLEQPLDITFEALWHSRVQA